MSQPMKDLCKEIQKLGKGIGNPTRYAILQLLMDGSKTVNEIVAAVGQSQPCISQHLKVLKESHLLLDKRSGQEIYYSINVAHMVEVLQKLTSDVQNSEHTK